jgi:hypothetical protein
MNLHKGQLFYLFGCLFALMLSGCATEYNPDDWYDAKAIEKPGRIVGKKVAKVEERRWADRHAMYIGAGIVIDNTSGRPSAQAIIYEYVIKLENKESISVLSEFSSHNIGDCVTVFFSDRPSYPRMAIRSACS